MPDLTLLLATANRLSDETARRIRANLLDVTQGRYPVVSVSQRPIEFGHNLCVGEIGANKYNAYWQLFIGAQAVETEYVAVIDDDVLYAPCHFEHRPPPGVFFYEKNYWFAQDGKDFFWRVSDRQTRGGGMWGCIAQTETLRANLAARFERFPNDSLTIMPDHKIWWGEPGIHDGDRLYGRHDSYERVESPMPCVVFVHQAAMGYTQLSRWHRRYGTPAPENITERVEPWGTMADLRRQYWEEEEPA